MIRNKLLYGLSVCFMAILAGCKPAPVTNVESSLAVNSTYEDPEELHFSEYHIVAINGFLMGGYYNNRWIGCDELYPMIAEKEKYKIYIGGQYQSAETGRKEPKTEFEMYSGPSVGFKDSKDVYNGESNIIAYSGDRDLTIESGTKINLENQTYQKINQDYVTEAGLTKDFELTNITRVDIDDDQQDEVFIQAYHYMDTLHESMGIQYMRKIVDDEVKEFMIPILSPAVKSDYLTIMGFCDLNGDGVKEVLVSSAGVGYSSYMVYEFNNSEFTRRFENGAYH